MIGGNRCGNFWFLMLCFKILQQIHIFSLLLISSKNQSPINKSNYAPKLQTMDSRHSSSPDQEFALRRILYQYVASLHAFHFVFSIECEVICSSKPFNTKSTHNLAKIQYLKMDRQTSARRTNSNISSAQITYNIIFVLLGNACIRYVTKCKNSSWKHKAWITQSFN